jgi:hypothetical protein
LGSDTIDDAIVWGEDFLFFRKGVALVYSRSDDKVRGAARPIAVALGGDPDTLPARALSAEQARYVLDGLQKAGDIEYVAANGKVNLKNIYGVKFLYLASGVKGQKADPSAPQSLDPRNAVGLCRLVRYLRDTWGATTFYHSGFITANHDCHEQGRAVDFVGVAGVLDGQEYTLTVYDDWAKANVPNRAKNDGTRLADWPANSADVTYRLADRDEADVSLAKRFFTGLYGFVASQFQDRSAGAAIDETPSTIGQSTYIMNPDHPTSKPGTKNGREAHRLHVHFQIGGTGWE